MVDLIKAQTLPPSLPVRSRLASAYPLIHTAVSSIFSFSHVSVIKAIPRSHRIGQELFSSHRFLIRAILCLRVSELFCVLKFEEEFFKGILIKLLLFCCTHLTLSQVLCVNDNGWTGLGFKRCSEVRVHSSSKSGTRNMPLVNIIFEKNSVL